ncbi:HD family phosphohydrolase [Bhargavaea ullalensis]|uniref:Nucleotidyltransferase with HDIG domain n=1 Tax=Bhargavaea ullalensis TaxID=1265685 RepID=A0ABV2G997_9BACL
MLQSLRNLLNRFSFAVLSAAVLVLAAVLAFAVMLGSVRDETYDIRLFQLANETIRAPKTVEDPVKTEEERERAASEITPVYDFDEEAAKNRSALVTSIFDFAIEAKGDPKPDDKEAVSNAPAKQLVILKDKLSHLGDKEASFSLDDDMLNGLIKADKKDLEAARDAVSAIVKRAMEQPVRENELAEAKAETERLIGKAPIPGSLADAAAAIGRESIIANDTPDEVKTEERISQAKASVEPTRILQGQVIVQEGQIIDREVYRQLELAGLLNEQSSSRPAAGLALFTGLIFWFIYRHFKRVEQPDRVKKKWLSIVLVIYFLVLIAMRLMAGLEKDFDMTIAYAFPTALVPLLVRLLADRKLALIMTVLVAVTGGLVLHEGYSSVINMEFALYMLFGGLAGYYLIQEDGRRSSILATSLGVSVVNGVYILFHMLMLSSQLEVHELAVYMAAALASGLLSGALTIGTMPFFESLFGILSDMRLVELSNPNHPLLKKILTETPGTYHHSVMVANLSDAACEAIGANGLLARVGSYYHDIGKTVRPAFFIENQMNGVNPHDSLPPEKSRDIIVAHASDGAAILKEHKMPEELVDIARQHHGTSLLKFFFVKAKETQPGVPEDSYRYPGPKPQTREIAVISIADSCEAAVRSMKAPTPEKIENLVWAIIRDKMNDGQFDECDLSFKELKQVGAVICTTLNGIFHNRIEYPE